MTRTFTTVLFVLTACDVAPADMLPSSQLPADEAFASVEIHMGNCVVTGDNDRIISDQFVFPGDAPLFVKGTPDEMIEVRCDQSWTPAYGNAEIYAMGCSNVICDPTGRGDTNDEHCGTRDAWVYIYPTADGLAGDCENGDLLGF